MNLERGIAGFAAAAINGLAWAQSVSIGNWSIGGLVTGITALSAAICTAVVFGLKQVGPAYVDFRKHLDDAHKESLAGQMAELQESLKAARDSLHVLRNDANAERLRHAEEREQHAAEAERLLGLVAILQKTIDQQNANINQQNADINNFRAEVTGLRAEIARLNGRIAELTTATDHVSAQLSGEQPSS